MPPIPQLVTWTVGAVAAVALGSIAAREWRRVNEALRAQRATPRPDVGREALPTLRRDPRTGIYRVERS